MKGTKGSSRNYLKEAKQASGSKGEKGTPSTGIKREIQKEKGEKTTNGNGEASGSLLREGHTDKKGVNTKKGLGGLFPWGGEWEF